MKYLVRLLVVLMVAVFTVDAAPVHAADRGGHWSSRSEGHWGGHWGGYLGPGWWGPGWWGPGWWWGYPYYPYDYSNYPTTPVIVQQPEVYTQPPAPRAEPQNYWYFCRDPEGYYPYVKKCPKGWMKVVPSVQKPEGEE